MDKTLCIHPSVDRFHPFVQGFLTSSNWTLVDVYAICDAFIYKASDKIIVSVHTDSVVSKIWHGVYSDEYQDFRIDMPGYMQFSNYLDIHSDKRFINMLPKRLSAHDIGLQFGLFSADAINEENYIRSKTQQNSDKEVEYLWG